MHAGRVKVFSDLEFDIVQVHIAPYVKCPHAVEWNAVFIVVQVHIVECYLKVSSHGGERALSNVTL